MVQNPDDGWVYKPGSSRDLQLSTLSGWRACTLEETLVALQVSFYRNADQERREAPEVEQLLIHPETALALAEALKQVATGALSGPPPGQRHS